MRLCAIRVARDGIQTQTQGVLRIKTKNKTEKTKNRTFEGSRVLKGPGCYVGLFLSGGGGGNGTAVVRYRYR